MFLKKNLFFFVVLVKIEARTTPMENYGHEMKQQTHATYETLEKEKYNSRKLLKRNGKGYSFAFSSTFAFLF
jgi:hypothetical protein